MTHNFSNIAFFDSGQGGLTLWESVVRRFPKLNTLYYGDNARYPYGNRSADTITRYTSEAAFYLVKKQAKLIIVACGTASSVAVEALQDIFKVPVIGIVEGFCRDAFDLVEENSTIVILGTRFTVNSKKFEHELRLLGANKIWAKACPLFVPLVEEGIIPGNIADNVAEMYLWDLPEDTNVIMLACTHFSRLAKSIAQIIEKKFKRNIILSNADGEWLLSNQKYSGSPIYLLDSSKSIVNYVHNFLGNYKNNNLMQSKHKIYCTDAKERFTEVAKIFIKTNLPEVEMVNTLDT